MLKTAVSQTLLGKFEKNLVESPMKLVEFLIMENLPLNGNYRDIDDLKNNVMSDFFSIKNHADLNIFESALENLNENQVVFINRGKNEVAATKFGINRFNKS